MHTSFSADESRFLDSGRKLQKILPLLGSDKDGEVVAAARATTRILEAHGQSWHDLARAVSASVPSIRSPDHDWRSVAMWLHGQGGLSPKERDFVRSMTVCASPSPKQKQWLSDLYARYAGFGFGGRS